MRRTPASTAAMAALALACAGRPTEPYGTCRSTATCAETTPTCVSFYNNVTRVSASLCTRACTTNNDCPGRGVCVEIVTGAWQRLCMAPCTRNEDCDFAGGFCGTARDGSRACVP